MFDVVRAVFPNNSAISLHYREFLLRGYLPGAEGILTKFPLADSSRELKPFSVGMVDGFCKVVIMLALLAAIDELEVSEDRLQKDADMLKTLKSFKYIHCAYQHVENPADHFLQALRALDQFCDM